MDKFCNSPIWDLDLSWNTEVPLFTPCFLLVALWIPAVFFWVFCSIEFYYISKSNKRCLPWTPTNILRIVSVCLILVASIADLVLQMIRYSNNENVRPIEYYTPFLLILTWVGILVMIALQRKRGIQSSGLLFIFWLLMLIATTAAVYNNMKKIHMDEFHFLRKAEFCLSIVYWGSSWFQFFLQCFSDIKFSHGESQNESPEESASFLSKMTFWWFNNMARLGYKQPLVADDMWDLNEEDQSEYLQSKFETYWLPLVSMVTRNLRKIKRNMSRKYSKADAFNNDDLNVEISQNSSQHDLSKLSILIPILKTFGFDLFTTGILKFLASIITFVNPLILDMLIAFVGSDEPYWKGFVYAAAMFLAALVESFLNGQYEYRIYVVAMRVRSCIISVVYKKALTLSVAARKNFTVGEVVNLMSVDTQRVMDYVQMVNLLWSAPLQIGIAIYLLWQQLGIATLGGLAIMVLMVPLNGVISVYIRKYQVCLMSDKDLRTKLMNEILNGIKVLKLYAWELSFMKEVMKFRNKEIDSLRSQAYLNAAITFAFTSAPFLISLASFAVFVFIDGNVLDANRAFVSLSLFNILRIPTALLPMIITFTAMFVVSLNRINKFLQGDELDPDAVSHDQSEKDPVVIENGTFSWTKDEAPMLNDLNFRVKEGELVAVVGTVGAGKSSLLSALLGDMVKWTGRVNVKGPVAYVPQQAWIQNATLRHNVLFVNSYDERKYNKVIEACALKQDLEILPGGDQTEIGEKGINLSGGQKQRISLARAVYDDAKVYYFDDPLSAVDAHVGKHIFEQVIGPNGMLKRKTRILVTHRISVLPEVDTIVVLKDGQVTETGSYKELLAKKGVFAEFLIQYIQESSAKEEISLDELSIMKEIAATVAPELTRHLSRLSDDSESDSDIKRMQSYTSQPSVTSQSLRKRTKSELSNPDKDFQRKQSIKKIAETGTKLTEKEGMELGSVSSSVYFDYIKSYGYWNCFWTVICYAAATGFSLGSSLWLSVWSNDSMDPSTSTDTHLRDLRLGVYGGLGAGEVVFTLVTSVLMNLAVLRAGKILHDGMLTHILKAPMSFFDTTPLGRILNRFSKDIDTADITIRFNIRILLIMTFRAVSSIIIISLETPIFLAAAVPLAVLYYFLQKFYIPTSRQLKRLESTTRSPIYSHFSETVTGASCIRAYEASDTFIKTSNNLVDKNNTSYYPSLGASRWLSIRLEFLGYSIVFLAALFAVLTRNTLSPGIAGLSVSYALQITSTLNMLVRATADVETNIVAVERCLEYTKTPTEADWTTDGNNKPKKSWPDNGLIKFDKYSTRYREGLDLVLKEISCDINPNERCGIVGRTGAGKSSLTLALFRIIEAADGKIVIDGMDIAKMGLHDLRSKLTIIPQDPVLFTGTLRMNLDPFDTYSDEALWKSLEQAHLKSFVSSLEKGLQHDVSEGGENLSVGQRQLVCLARALLRKSKVLILDEATAAVDVETDELIQNTIRSAFNDCTIMTIAHRLNTIMDYDKVMVLSTGKIAEFDSPGNLLENQNSMFYSMAKDAGLV